MPERCHLSTQTSLATFIIDPPSPFDFRHPEEWKNWLVRYNRYCNISGLNQLNQISQIDALIYTMGPEAERILNSLILTKKERKLYDKVLQKLDAYFTQPKVNVIFERAKFNQRVQQQGESFDAFVKELYNLADNCRFGVIKEELIRDRIVAGMSDIMLSSIFQMDPDLTLHNLIAMVTESGFVEMGSPVCPSPCSSPGPSPSYDVPEQQSEPNETVGGHSSIEKEIAGSSDEQLFQPKITLIESLADCNESASNEMEVPSRKQSNLKKVNCTICNKICRSPFELKKHLIRSHPGEKPFSCDSCGLRFSTNSKLKIHNRKKHTVKSCSCDICGKVFKTNSYLQRHNRTVHSKDKGQCCCEICGKIFSKRRHLTVHMNIHAEDKPYSCDVCGNKFSSSTYLKQHKQAIHSGEKPFCCDVCGNTFTFFTSLKRHVSVVHVGDKLKKKLRCPCGKMFEDKQKLDNHTRTHTGEKPFSCDMCDYRCAQKSNLKIHKKVHTRDSKPISKDQ